jgi:DNA invertase Pin-like site-specific DNA recombinase
MGRNKKNKNVLEKTKLDEVVERSIYKKEKAKEERDNVKQMLKDGKEVKVIAYCRVSTQIQGEDGDSLDNQKQTISKYCQDRGLTLVDTYQEVMSGAVHWTARPMLSNIIRKLKLGEIDGLVVLKMDRLSRSIKDTIDLINLFAEKNWAFFEIKNNIDISNASGRFLVHMLGALAELERSTIQERVKEIVNYKRQNGQLLGQAPFGKAILEKNGLRLLVEDKDEQETINMILELREQKTKNKQGKLKAMSLKMICQQLMIEERKNKDGRVLWFPSQVQRILKQHRKINLDKSPEEIVIEDEVGDNDELETKNEDKKG